MPPSDTHASSLVTALRPSEARGGAALVAGSTSRHRRSVIDEVARAFEAANPRWLVVRLPPTALHGRLSDALSTAVDDALHAAHAPGALHDEADISLASRVGSWLYRARAASFEGLALIIDDLDAWLDARGAASPSSDVVGLLSTCRRGTLSVLASARAASASGAPALPAEILASFEATVSLGGAPLTVTRDPGTLVAALSGRSFNLGGLQASLAGWLDLPPPAPERGADDTLIVFSSPLAAPPLPEDPSLTLDWTDPRPAPSPAPLAPTAPARGEDVARLASALRAAVELGTAVRRARNAPVTTPSGAVRAFVDSASKIPLGLEAVSSATSPSGVEMRNLTVAAHAAMAQFDLRFEPVLRSVEAGDADATRCEDLPAKLAPLAARIDAKSTAIVVLPGLRVDLWERFKNRVLAKVTGLATAGEEGVAWSLEAHSDELAESSLEDAASPRREHRGTLEITRISAYAAGLREGVTLARVEEVEAALVPALRALCGSFAGRTAVLFASEQREGLSPAERRSAFAALAPYGLYTYSVRNA